jgi:hypothetical protein
LAATAAWADNTPPSTSIKVDPLKPTAIMLGSPQGAVVITPEMVDQIVRAQTPEYLRSIPGTPAPAAIDSRTAVPIKPGKPPAPQMKSERKKAASVAGLPDNPSQ